jgi:hypothetical protein
MTRWAISARPYFTAPMDGPGKENAAAAAGAAALALAAVEDRYTMSKVPGAAAAPAALEDRYTLSKQLEASADQRYHVDKGKGPSEEDTYGLDAEFAKAASSGSGGLASRPNFDGPSGGGRGEFGLDAEVAPAAGSMARAPSGGGGGGFGLDAEVSASAHSRALTGLSPVISAPPAGGGGGLGALVAETALT